MYSKIEKDGDSTRLLSQRNEEFQRSIEMILRVHSFGCLSLKIGSVLSACLVILYSVLSLAQCTATLATMDMPELNDKWTVVATGLLVIATLVHIVTLFMTALMLVGALREKAHQMRPWIVWTSIQVTVKFLLFVFLLTMSMLNHMDENSLVYCLIDFLALLVRFYMLMLVASYHRTLEDEHSDGERLKTLVNNEIRYNSA